MEQGKLLTGFVSLNPFDVLERNRFRLNRLAL